MRFLSGMRCYYFDSGATDPPRCFKALSVFAFKLPLFYDAGGFFGLVPIGTGQITGRFSFLPLVLFFGGLPSDLHTDISSSEMSSITSLFSGLSFFILSVVDLFRLLTFDPDYTFLGIVFFLRSISSVSLLELICVELF